MTPYDPTQTQQTQLPKVPPPQIPVAAGASPQVQPAPALARGITGAMAPQGSAAAGIGQAKPLATSQPSQPTRGPQATEYARLLGSKPGAESVHNPFLRTLATVGDVLAGTLLGRNAAVIPGTTAHHNMLLEQAETGAKGEQEAQNAPIERRLKQATAEHLGAETNELIPAQVKNYESEAENRLHPKAEKQAGTVHEDSEGNYWVIHGDGSATQVAPQGQPLKGKTKEESGGTVHEDDQGNMWVVKADGSAIPVTPKGTTAAPTTTNENITSPPIEATPSTGPVPSKQLKGKVATTSEETTDIKNYNQAKKEGFKGTFEQWQKEEANRKNPSTSTGTWTFAIDNDNKNILVNTKTGATMPAPSGAHRPIAALENREAQGRIIQQAGDQLLSSIEKNRGKLGNVGSYWNQAVNGTPIADPEISGLMAQISSFAALQPALHGFRGQQALSEFTKIIGGVPKNPDAMEAAIKAIQGTAGIVAGGGTGAPQSGAGTGADMITVKTKDGQTGQIHATQKDRFLKDNPGSAVVNAK